MVMSTTSIAISGGSDDVTEMDQLGGIASKEGLRRNFLKPDVGTSVPKCRQLNTGMGKSGCVGGAGGFQKGLMLMSQPGGWQGSWLMLSILGNQNL